MNFTNAKRKKFPKTPNLPEGVTVSLINEYTDVCKNKHESGIFYRIQQVKKVKILLSPALRTGYCCHRHSFPATLTPLSPKKFGTCTEVQVCELTGLIYLRYWVDCVSFLVPCSCFCGFWCSGVVWWL